MGTSGLRQALTSRTQAAQADRRHRAQTPGTWAKHVLLGGQSWADTTEGCFLEEARLGSEKEELERLGRWGRGCQTVSTQGSKGTE